MAQIIGSQAGKLSQTDALMIAGTKILSERILAQFIGDGSLFSGGAKMLGATLIKKFVGGNAGTIISTAMTVDGAEDIVLAFLPNISGGIFGNKTSEIEVI